MQEEKKQKPGDINYLFQFAKKDVPKCSTPRVV